MPPNSRMKRDEQPEQGPVKPVETFVTQRQQSRSRGHEEDLALRPSTPFNEPQPQQVQSSNNVNVARSIGQYQLAPDNGNTNIYAAASKFKMPVPNTILHPDRLLQPRPAASSGRVADSHQAKQHVSGRAVKSEKISVFDDTESFHTSMLDDPDPEENRTAILHPPLPVRGSVPQRHDNREESDLGITEFEPHGTQDLHGINLEPTWREDVHDERVHQAYKKGHNPNPFQNDNQARSTARRSNSRPVKALGNDYEPQTPSRTQSAPPIEDVLHAPIARTVGFADKNQVHNYSPDFRSSEMAREDTVESPVSRSSSVQPYSQTMTKRVQELYRHNLPSNQSDEREADMAPRSERFIRFHAQHQQQHPVQESQKVSAPDSDTHENSEDEHPQPDQRVLSQTAASVRTQQTSPPAGKRSHDDMMNGLDYSSDDLKVKTLHELQSEVFTQDPQRRLKFVPTSKPGDDIPFPDVLENLSRVSSDDQRGIFKSLTDEQWAKTGQWFVDKFQQDLEKLSRVRLERRKIALKYEDTIRRRQRLVEHYEADLVKELDELQAGGKQLVAARKAPSGSRAGTPVKNVR